ncbi:DAG protein [Musa troglodytarum]|uniref:DAG protein n=1 Tax=Musa troglodytarum TaxID=320322 RepID=A0A9E7JBK7_9LILI|nr:DAG protein [Musa troglodytarum]
MDKPGGERATKQQMIDCYIQTLAKVVGSEEEAKKKIYNVSCLPGVLFVLPDSYVDAENKDHGGIAELFVRGEIVQRPPERQRRIDAATARRNDRDRPRSNDRSRYVTCRESQ